MVFLPQILFGTYQQCNVAPEIFLRPKSFLKTFGLKGIAGLETEQIADRSTATFSSLYSLLERLGYARILEVVSRSLILSDASELVR